jgi:hypothetical protein
MIIYEKEEKTLKQLIEEIESIKKNLDCEVWIEGLGNGKIKLVFQEKKITII